MTHQSDSLIYNIAIYYLDNKFYITPMVRKPPGARTQVLPLFIVLSNNVEKFAEAIESARLKSDIRYKEMENMVDREEWDGDNEKIWNNAQKTWDVFWNNDGTVDIDFARPYAKHKNGIEWIFVPEAKKILPSPVSPPDIAREILNQLK